MRSSRLDAIDLKLLGLLQADARMSQQDLAEAVGLSSPATGERIRKLIERGIIRYFCAVLDPAMLGQDVAAFISVSIDGSEYFKVFVEKAKATSEILECHAVSGEADYLLRVVAADLKSFSDFLMHRLLRLPMVAHVRSSILLDEVKSTTALPLGRLR